MLYRCCYRRGLLRRLYTQNIDGLDFQTGIPEELLISVHGTMGTASCEFCGQGVPLSGFRDDVAANIKDIYGQDACAPKESQPIICKSCARPGVKPDTVLYGRSLPDRFFSCMGEDMKELDVLIIAGTSLTVSPANQLVNAVPESCVRVVVNNEPVGSSLGICYGTESRRDIFLQGTCDSVFLELATRLGWRHDLASSSAKMSEASAAMLAL